MNDWGEPSNHHCFESMVKEVLEYPNEPVVILLFSMRNDGWNLQADLRKIGDKYDLLMVSIPDGLFSHVGKEITQKGYGHARYLSYALHCRIKDPGPALCFLCVGSVISAAEQLLLCIF